MAENPLPEDVVSIRSDIERYSSERGGKTLDDFISLANAQLKRDLEDWRQIEWSQVYDSDTENDYLSARNSDKIKNAICLLTIAIVFEDYSTAADDITTGSGWLDLSLYYYKKYEDAIRNGRLDLDLNEDGAIDSDTNEEMANAQVFFRR